MSVFCSAGYKGKLKQSAAIKDNTHLYINRLLIVIPFFPLLFSQLNVLGQLVSSVSACCCDRWHDYQPPRGSQGSEVIGE